MSKSIAALSLLSLGSQVQSFTTPPVKVLSNSAFSVVKPDHVKTSALMKPEEGQPEERDTRRKFMGDLVKATTFGAAFVASQAVPEHSDGCGCGDCAENHDDRCDCFWCQGGFLNFVGTKPAMAYYDRPDVGGPDASAETKAFNTRARETEARLDAMGFPLDTKEEEAKRLSDAMASFSYDNELKKKNMKGSATQKKTKSFEK